MDFQYFHFLAMNFQIMDQLLAISYLLSSMLLLRTFGILKQKHAHKKDFQTLLELIHQVLWQCRQLRFFCSSTQKEIMHLENHGFVKVFGLSHITRPVQRSTMRQKLPKRRQMLLMLLQMCKPQTPPVNRKEKDILNSILYLLLLYDFVVQFIFIAYVF